MLRNEIKLNIIWIWLVIKLWYFSIEIVVFEEALHQINLPNIHAIFIWNIVFTFSDLFMAKITKLLEKYWIIHNISFGGDILYYYYCKYFKIIRWIERQSTLLMNLVQLISYSRSIQIRCGKRTSSKQCIILHLHQQWLDSYFFSYWTQFQCHLWPYHFFAHWWKNVGISKLNFDNKRY